MGDIVEMNLTKAVNMTTTSFIRSALRARIKDEGLEGPPVELMRFHVFIVCTRGTGQHMVDFHHHQMRSGRAIWIRPGQVQRWCDVHEGFDADVMVFSSSAIPDLPLFDHFLGATSVTQLNEDKDRLRQQMQWMANDLEANADHAVAAAVVGVILRLFARQAHYGEESIDTPSRRLATAFVDSIDHNIEQRSVAWHARQIGASTRTVARATTEVLGQRPKEVIDARVILEARRRLAWSDHDIATIARDLSFSEPSNFTKFFRTRTGTSPSHFRQTVSSLGLSASQ